MRGGGGAPVPTLFNQKIGLFHEKIICSEQPIMQNKHQKSCWCPNVPSPNVGTPTTKKKFDAYFAFQAILSILFFHEKSPIFWVKRVGTGTPPTPLIWILSHVYPKFDRLFFAHFQGDQSTIELMRYCPPFMYYVFHHIYGQFQGKLSFGQF